MTALSARYVPWLLLSMVVVLFPALRAGFEVRRTEDCANPRALLQVGSLPRTGAVAERFEKYDEDVPQWTVARLDLPERDLDLQAAIVRSFNPIELYTRPPRVLLGSVEIGQRQTERIEVDGQELALQTIYDGSKGRSHMASYLFLYGNEPVEHPAWAQLRRAPGQIFGGTRPLSLLIVGGVVPAGQRQLAREEARQWLVAAYRFHQAACVPADS